jgi:TrmH family RNA methyltransferase
MKFEDTEYPQLSKNHLADLKKLKQKKYRHLEAKTLAEGINLLEQLWSNGIKPLEIITSNPLEKDFPLPKFSGSIYMAKPHEIEQLADTETPQPIIGIYAIPEFTVKEFRLAVYLDGIRDPGNLGTIFRICAAFKADAVILSPDCCEVFSPKVIRASLGSVFWIPSMTADSNWLAEQTAEKAGLVMHGNVRLKDYKPDTNKPVILIVGSEGSGISSDTTKELTTLLRIPISDKMESLNAAVAAGIALYEISERFSG